MSDLNVNLSDVAVVVYHTPESDIPAPAFWGGGRLIGRLGEEEGNLECWEEGKLFDWYLQDNVTFGNKPKVLSISPNVVGEKMDTCVLYRWEDVASLEWPVVIYAAVVSHNHRAEFGDILHPECAYRAMSRATTKLIVIVTTIDETSTSK